MNHDRRWRDLAGQPLGQARLPGFDRAADDDAPGGAPEEAELWIARVRQALALGDAGAPRVAATALQVCPADPELLLLGALAALSARDAPRALVLLRHYTKRYVPGKPHALLSALAAAGHGQFTRAAAMLQSEGLAGFAPASRVFVGDPPLWPWLRRQLTEIAHRRIRLASPPRPKLRPATLPQPRSATPPRAKPAAANAPAPSRPALPDLPCLAAPLTITREFVNPDEILFKAADGDPVWFALRAELARLGLVEGFDELLCLPTLSGVVLHWYQIETVRKVLRQYRGRVLLADEVGLGKTIEAGMVLKEYALRGMAERMLILAPASLVGQWREELAEKFVISCATTYDPALRADPGSFWAGPRIIASLATARRSEHAELLAAQSWDIVVVDEAHHLRDQASASWRLVNSLRKRFLLLLSATPVQNNLIELYNLLTLLKPGIFKTVKEFRAAYMLPGKPREPVNRDRLRDLMRGVMVRNTRALAAVHLPRRHAATERAQPGPAEAACYAELTRLVRARAAAASDRLALAHLLAAAGSSPPAAAAALARAAGRHPEEPLFAALAARYRAIPAGAKDAALLALLARNPGEKKIVFVHRRESLAHLAALLGQSGIGAAQFHGSLNGPEKDTAITFFRDSAPVLLTTESGGEGRNLQFCNTLINYDIPWNPMAIEQRIGRIDRIGQVREVFVFNLVAAGTVEDEVLRILDEKLHMFELVVGEVGAILGELEERGEFSTLVLEAWLAETEADRATAFAGIESDLLAARRDYEDAKALDETLFGTDLDAA